MKLFSPAIRNQMGFVRTVMAKQAFQCLIQVTNRCNMQCEFCDFWRNGASSREEVTISQYQQLGEDLSRLGHLVISIEGGEPFVRPDLVDIVRVLSQHHLTVLFTNGWYVTDEKAKALFDAELTQVGVSIDFPDAQRHDELRGKQGAFDKALQAADLFKRHAPAGGQQVHLMSVVMQDNQGALEALLQLSAAKKVGHYFTLLSHQGFRRDSTRKLPDDRVAQTLLDLRQRYKHMRSTQGYLKGIHQYLQARTLQAKTLPPCNAGQQSFNIDHLGNVSPCIEKIQISYGNIGDQSIGEILKHMQQDSQQKINGCQDCWTLCRGNAQMFGQRYRLGNWLDIMSRRHAT